VTLVDTNVLIDLATNDPAWADWSQKNLEMASLKGPLLINEIIYAELSVGFEAIEALDAFVESAGLTLGRLSNPALFLAGKAFKRYRNMGGLRSTILADFFIGAHAAVNEMSLLTRDAKRYRTHFPTVELISP